MKQSFLILTVSIFLLSFNKKISRQQFQAQRVEKSATIKINGKMENVFPLFGAFEERKWADDWNPVLIYPSVETMQEGTTFKTKGHGHNEDGFLWIVTKYQPDDHLVQYLVSTANRYWTITVKCQALNSSITEATVTYSFTSLNEVGNEINPLMLHAVYKQGLADWEKAINYYLDTGKTLKE